MAQILMATKVIVHVFSLHSDLWVSRGRGYHKLVLAYDQVGTVKVRGDTLGRHCRLVATGVQATVHIA